MEHTIGSASVAVKRNVTAPTDTRSRILLATIESLERYGVTGATVRRITEAAGVNVAAINYHFGSKEALLESALDQTLREAFPQNMSELRQHIADSNGDVAAGTRAFFTHYLVNAFSYPRISVAHLRNALLDQDYSGPAVQAARDFVDGFYKVVSPAMLQRTEGERRMAVRQVWAAVFALAMLPQLFGTPRETMTGPEMVGRFCATLFESL